MRAGNVLQLALLGLFTLALGIPVAILALLLPGKARKGRFFRLVSRIYCRAALALFGIGVRVRGLSHIDPGRSYIFMANHVSLADTAALVMAIPQPLHWVFKKELSRIPVFGWVLLVSGQIMVDREDPEQSKAALDAAALGLSGNSSILIYPEGTRSRDGRLLPFKKGGFWMAVRSGLPIVPVRVTGTAAIVPAGTLRVVPGTATVSFLPPVPTAGKMPEDIPALMARVREAMESFGTPGPG